MDKPLVYIASPYTKGDPGANVHFQGRIFQRLMNEGLVWPIIPLWNHFQHIMFPRPAQDWLDYDLVLLRKCDALLRLDTLLPSIGYHQAESSGADNEVEVAKSLGIPVFLDFLTLEHWVKFEYGRTKNEQEDQDQPQSGNQPGRVDGGDSTPE